MYSVELVSEFDGTIAKGLTFDQAEKELEKIEEHIDEDDVGDTYQIIETNGRKVKKEMYIQSKDITRFITL
jgi:hypothetical protein